MDRHRLSRKQRPDAPRPANALLEATRDKRTQTDRLRRPASGKIRTAKDSNEITRVPRRTAPLDRPQADEDPNARHFTVANVGPGGQLYLKPSRMPPSSFAQAPATPPDTSDGEHAKRDWPGERQSNASGTWTPQLRAARAGAWDRTIPVPPLSLSNALLKRRQRSHSFSTASEHEPTPTFDASDFQLLVNGKGTGSRPKSSVDLTGGFLDLHIPHYRLGTPQFSERGTAYLHSSMYTATTNDDLRSSTMSRAEYDKLFPAPPGRAHGSSATPRNPSETYLHPAAAYSLTSAKTPPTPPTAVPSPAATITPAIFEAVEANANDPAMVRYNPQGRIAAATPARLVAQITSPVFLDYELLSDFFLTYRTFLPSRDLLEYLLARMRWAFGTLTDAGRIVRVRTFVALRHWILNYFADDFAMDTVFRQRFCTLVNELSHTLRQRQDRGGSDMNIIGELKKCWRRTCALYWPTQDVQAESPEADVSPGGGMGNSVLVASGDSLAYPPPAQRPRADFRRVSAPLLISDEKFAPGQDSTMRAFGPGSMSTTRTASIPASPMSEQSLQVLSCSVPFLRHMRPMTEAEGRVRNARPVGPKRNPPTLEPQQRPRQHKRSGSFNDALRDERTPLPSAKGDGVDARALPAIVLAGGLVRGLLLQPSPSKVEMLIPISPGIDPRAVRFAGLDESYFPDRAGQNGGVRRIVGDVRRALSSRPRYQDSPTRSRGSHRSTNSSGSHNSAHNTGAEKANQHSAWQQLRGPPRMDVLGEMIGRSYDEAFLEANLPNPANEQAHQELAAQEQQQQRASGIAPDEPDRAFSLPRPNFDRWNSRLTTSSRSIVIMDDTGFPMHPQLLGALPSVRSTLEDMVPQPLFRNPEEVFGKIAGNEYHAGARARRPTPPHSDGKVELSQPPSDMQVHSSLVVPDSWYAERAVSDTGVGIPSAQAQARKSSGVHSPTMNAPQMHHQLRRRPGGDLKAADHVHELEPVARPDTYGSLSTVSRSGETSGVQSYTLSGTHFSGQDFSAWRMPTQSVPAQKKDSVSLLSLEPDLRASFQVEVTKLAKIPDRPHDGGIEDTLRMLEGHGAQPVGTTTNGEGDKSSPPAQWQPWTGSLDDAEARESDGDLATFDFIGEKSPMTATQGASIYRLSSSEAVYDHRLQSVGSSDQYGSSEAQGLTAPVLPPSSEAEHFPIHQPQSPQTPPKSVAFAKEPPEPPMPDKVDRTTKSDSGPKSTTPQGSFLLDDNESLSDISTEIADHSGDEELGVRSFFFDDNMDDDDVLPHSFKAPPTPPSTVGAPPDQSSPERMPARLKAADDVAHKLKEAQSAPKLMSPNADRQRLEQYQQVSSSLQPPLPELRRVRTAPSAQPPVHLPFVLAFESEVIAEQLTIIEKDALDEVDWKDLIGLRWQQAAPNVRNWVEYLKLEYVTGVDIVVARFNLVVKWVVSEIVLTTAPSERARCIAKFIHIATHCHRLRNYASLYQITLALLSADLSRLHMTWALVAPVEKQKLERLERLCQPIRNFQNLRAEMETSTGQDGCIPFIGLYTHDLMYNAQKPARTEPEPPSTEALVNFERYQTAATIVKSLLRLIEASSKYVFHAHPEVLSRCLWLAALEDVEIVSRSKALEQ
ncbi:hypothetical protein B0A54_02597 [Friedmanniomyces endolithicus]|uniref:Ras GEF n=1 Tax=Friedmanniomyces endolithicus TaxID=329885 RepID=A0A4V5NAB6_9PEZI|nr:hypothetical protein B0A54_02597 [Friedmanniomyces endolithicus]